MAAPPHQAQPKRRPARPALLAAVALAVVMLVPLPAGADHVQTQATNGSTFTVQFDHDGDNAYWVEFQARASNGDGMFIGFARVEGSSTWHYMQFAANTWERQQQGWSKFEPDESFHVPPGKRVQFKVGMTDGATGGTTGEVLSCWFTHPAGVEQCGTSTTTTTTGGTFDPAFSGFRGNEWWVQANVGTTSHCIAKVDVRADNGAWMPLSKQSWGPTAWAGSYHFAQGSVLQMRATSCSGQVDLSSCRQWIPPSGQDAAIVACPGTSSTTTSTGPSAFDATFTNVRGNEYWAEAVITANGPIHAVLMKNCTTGEEEHDMSYRADWGKWVLGRHIPDGSKVYMTAIGGGGSDSSGTYIWPSATPSTPC